LTYRFEISKIRDFRVARPRWSEWYAFQLCSRHFALELSHWQKCQLVPCLARLKPVSFEITPIEPFMDQSQTSAQLKQLSAARNTQETNETLVTG